jgi:hypothetical protein
MKKLLLGAAILLTACNLAAGVAYAEKCTGKSGARACGDRCFTLENGECGCGGTCTSSEMDWVSGAGKTDPIAEMETLAY